MKVCTKCHTLKDPSEFWRKLDGSQPQCKVCQYAKSKEVGPDGLTPSARWRKNNPGKRNTYLRDYLREHNYGITPEQFNAILSRQLNACAICREENKVWCVDHDHATGKVRAILCRNCNLAIGHLKDSARIAAGVAEYLTKHGNF